jgi:hypothetical protein
MAVFGLFAGASRTLLIQRRRLSEPTWDGACDILRASLRSPHRIHRRDRRGAALVTVDNGLDMLQGVMGFEES